MILESHFLTQNHKKLSNQIVVHPTQGWQTIPLWAALGFCLPLRSRGRHGLVITAGWVRVSAPGAAGTSPLPSPGWPVGQLRNLSWARFGPGATYFIFDLVYYYLHDGRALHNSTLESFSTLTLKVSSCKW